MKPKSRGKLRTYIHSILTRWTPEAARVLRGGLLVTLTLEAGALILWYAATPFRAETYEVWRSAQAMRSLIPATLAITLFGGAGVEYTARRKAKSG